MVYHSPKWWKEFNELRKRNELAQRSAVKEDLACSGSSRISNKSDQAISDEASTEATSVRPGPGLKPQATEASSLKPKRQASSKASSIKPTERQASSD